MEFLVTIVGLIILLVFAASILSFIHIVQISALKDEVRRISAELQTLRAREVLQPGQAAPAADVADVAPETETRDSTFEETPPVEAEAIAARLSEIDEAAAAPPPPAGPKPGLEERLGSQLTVWIGGLALALGGVFMVKYTIDAGLLGPAGRIFLGGLLALVLGGLGEYTRRADIVEQIKARGSEQLAQQLSGLSNAYVPGILTAAGLITAFATVYAAFALYGFISGFTAFVLLAAISGAGLAVSVLHGPWLAVIGLLGGYVTPLLIPSKDPSTWLLFSYLLALTAAVYLTAWLRGWLGLARLACGASVAWGVFWLLAVYRVTDALPLGLYVVGLVCLGLVFLREEADRSNDAPYDASTAAFWNGDFDWPLLQILMGNVLLWLAYVIMEGHGQLSVLVSGTIIALFLGTATRWERLMPLAVLGSSMLGLLLVTWPAVQFWSILDFDPYGIIGSGGARRLAMVAATGAAAIAGAGLWHTFLRRPQVIWGGVAAAVPVLTFTYTYLRVTEFEKSLPFAIVGLALGGLFGVLAERLDRVEEYADVAEPARGWAVGALAGAASAFIALALTINFDKGWLTIGLAAMAPALAWISTKRPIPILRWIVAILAAIVMARLLWDPRIVGDAISATPVFNWILYGYGLPTLAFGGAAYLLGREGDDLPAKITRGGAIAFLMAFVGMEIRHLMTGGDVYSGALNLSELALHTLSWLGLSFGLRWQAARTHDSLMMQAANLVGLGGFFSIALGHFVLQNPMVTHDAIAGNLVFNDILLAYALPAIMCGLIVWQVSQGWFTDGETETLEVTDETPISGNPRLADIFRMTAGALALVLAFAYLTLQVSRIFQGPVMAFDPSDGELYTWSAVWIAFAIGLLAFGIRMPSYHLRQAGFAVLLVATLKIFLVDMGQLTGLLRALSFIGLGAVLVGIGYAYQRLMLGNAAGTPPETPDDAEATPT